MLSKFVEDVKKCKKVIKKQDLKNIYGIVVSERMDHEKNTDH